MSFTPLPWPARPAHDGAMNFLRTLKNLVIDFVYGIDAGNAIRHGRTPRCQPPRKA
ncbi:hypothetical protein GCM10027436_38370 [Actinophytocola sediminis]